MKHPTKITICLTLTLLIVSIYALAGPIPDTGQTKCYNNTEEIPCPQPGEPFYGQDGNYIINPPSYTKLDEQGNDLPDSATEWVMVRDNVTGLIWEVKTDDGSVHDKDNKYTWYDSNDETNFGNAGTAGDGTDTEDFLRELNESNFGGFFGWRLPTVNELISIIYNVKIESSDSTSYFPNTMLGDYWSSISRADNPQDVWIYYFNLCHIDITYKPNSAYVRAVRGGRYQSLDNYIRNNDGTITDIKTGLMWQTGNTNLNWKEAIAYCENLKLAGYTDWRLPNNEELRSINSYIRVNPSLKTEYFYKTVPDKYWSSTTYFNNKGHAFIIYFNHNTSSDQYIIKSSPSYVQAVRGGQCQKADNLYIISPEQSARLNIGSNYIFTWETKAINGNVRISLSRYGGKDGTFEVIAENTENDGSYEWLINGPESFNCALKIEPLDDPLKGNIQSLFSICAPKDFFSSFQNIRPNTYSLSLFGLYTDGPFPMKVDWLCDDSSIVIKDNILTGNQNRWIKVFTSYKNRLFKKWLCIYTDLEYMEIEPNNIMDNAFPIENEKFYNAGFYNGDIDYYLINLLSDSIIRIGYISFSYSSDMKISIYNSNNKLMSSNVSLSGTSLNLSLGLSQGSYFLKCESAGDVDEDNGYVISYKIIESLFSRSTIPISTNQQKQSVINNLEDHSDFSFTLENNSSIRLLFTASTDKYHIELLNENQTLIDQIDYLVPLPVKLEANYPSGDYIVRVTPIEYVDATNTFTLELNDSVKQLEAEPNNTYLKSTEFNPEQPIIGRISTTLDSDFYTFQLDIPKYLELSLLSESDTNFDLILYKDSDKNQISSITFQYDDIIPMHMGLGVGRYFIKIAGSESNLHYYTLNIRDSSQENLEIEPNNNISYASAISNVSPSIGTIYSATDIDYYGFYLPSPSMFSVHFKTSTQTGDNKISIVDSNDQIIDLRHSPNGKACTIDAYQYPGNYYIKIENNGTVDQYNGYTLNISSDTAIEGLSKQ